MKSESRMRSIILAAWIIALSTASVPITGKIEIFKAEYRVYRKNFEAEADNQMTGLE